MISWVWLISAFNVGVSLGLMIYHAIHRHFRRPALHIPSNASVDIIVRGPVQFQKGFANVEGTLNITMIETLHGG